jgi:hypothetical protein
MEGVALDHLVWAVPDLAAGIADLERRLGARATPGGRHPAWATANALIGLGDLRYLEIVGPDPEAAPPPGSRPFLLDSLAAPRLVTWCARTSDLPAMARAAESLGIDLGEIARRGRQRPDGVELSWTMTDPLAEREGSVIPFFIDWGANPHPAASLAPACELISLRIEHPDTERIRASFRSLRLDVPVETGPTPRLIATLRTPRGTVELS